MSRIGTPRRISLIGQRFTRLTVIDRANPPDGYKGRDAFWLCLCDCGTRRSASAKSLRHGTVQSCGCLQKEKAAETGRRNTKHGHARRGRVSDEYNIWNKMIARCSDPSDNAFADYGGRGIAVCDRWRGPDGFPNFFADMGQRPSRNRSLDRIDNNGNYCPDNCRWATRSEQSRNRRDRTPMTHNGRTMYLVDWAKEAGISIFLLHQRIYRLGWDFQRAIETDPKAYHKRR